MNNLKNKTICAILTLGMAVIALMGCTNEKGNTEQTDKQTLSELLIGKWNFVESQEKKNGRWAKTELVSPEEATEEFRTDGIMAISYTYQGETEEYEMKWTLDDETGDLKAYDDEGTSIGTVSFSEDGDTLYIAYARFKHIDNPEMFTYGEFRDVHSRNKSKGKQ